MLGRALDLDEEDFCLTFELALGLGFAVGARTAGLRTVGATLPRLYRRVVGETIDRGTVGR